VLKEGHVGNANGHAPILFRLRSAVVCGFGRRETLASYFREFLSLPTEIDLNFAKLPELTGRETADDDPQSLG
jgi:hypothetical protein